MVSYITSYSSEDSQRHYCESRETSPFGTRGGFEKVPCGEAYVMFLRAVKFSEDFRGFCLHSDPIMVSYWIRSVCFLIIPWK